MTAIIFAGPSLPPKCRPADRDIIWLPPVRQGDLYRAALTRPAIIGVLDGYFETVPTVWHKEILWAMSQGIHVYGAASTGALRAAELDAFGMTGVGRIYADFRDGVLEDDDEVALLHGPEELGYPLLTEAMVNVRATLSAAERDGVVSAPLAVALTRIAKSVFYKARTYRAMFDEAATAGLEASALARLAAWLPASRLDQKRRDALAMVDAILAHCAAGTQPLRVDYELADTAAWQAARRRVDDESV